MRLSSKQVVRSSRRGERSLGFCVYLLLYRGMFTSGKDLRDRNEDWGLSDKVHALKESGGVME